MASSPSTPISRYRLQHTYRPFSPSPLASPSPSRSPPSSNFQKQVPERRRLQFKSTTSSVTRSSTLPSSSPSSTRTRHTSSSRTRSVPSSSGSTNTILSPSTSHHVTYPPFNHPEDPQKQFLRERLKAKCLDRAQKARARAVKKRRYTGYSDRSSDGFDVDDQGGGSNRMDDEEDEDEDDDDIMGDELFRRIMAQTNRKMDHSYRLSYAQEVGSSFDPDMEDVGEWERLMQGNPQPPQDFSPGDLDDEELEAYAEECVRQAALDEWADIPEEELFQLPSDLDEILEENPKVVDDMDVS